MDKIKIGIPRGLFYEDGIHLWQSFFEKLECEIVVSPVTNKKIIEEGSLIAPDEMCLSFKIFLGHVIALKDKVDYILIPRIDNYGCENQTCTNFLAAYDIVHNLVTDKLLNYNINLENHETEKKGFIKMGRLLGKKRKEIVTAYRSAKKMEGLIRSKAITQNYNKLSSNKLKILFVGHSYQLHDVYLMQPILEQLKELDVEVIYSDLFDTHVTNLLSKHYSPSLYWKQNKEAIGAIKLVERQIDGVIFLSTFPCGPDSLVNELVMRKITLPYLNLVVDDIDSFVGIKTRLESFVDIRNARK